MPGADVWLTTQKGKLLVAMASRPDRQRQGRAMLEQHAKTLLGRMHAAGAEGGLEAEFAAALLALASGVDKGPGPEEARSAARALLEALDRSFPGNRNADLAELRFQLR